MKGQTDKKNSKKKILLIILCAVVVLLVACDWILSVSIYNENFDLRFESDEALLFHLSDFEGLQRTQYKFASDKGQMITGYMYSVGSGQRGIIVIAHGFGGGGHNSYMDCAYFFAQHGYYVFAYDVTGNDESEGDGVPPPTQTTVPFFSMCVGFPSGPRIAPSSSPTFLRESFNVVAPTA